MLYAALGLFCFSSPPAGAIAWLNGYCNMISGMDNFFEKAV